MSGGSTRCRQHGGLCLLCLLGMFKFNKCTIFQKEILNNIKTSFVRDVRSVFSASCSSRERSGNIPSGPVWATRAGVQSWHWGETCQGCCPWAACSCSPLAERSRAQLYAQVSGACWRLPKISYKMDDRRSKGGAENGRMIQKI